jgi:ferredoxin--NADP+ reductase
MTKILHISPICPDIFEIIIKSPDIAKKAQAGHFVVLMVEEKGERIPLTIADWDREKGTITLIVMVVGTTTAKLTKLAAGDCLYALVGPMGHPSIITDYHTVIMVAGGVGTAPIYPIARELYRKGNQVVVIQGARSQNLLFWQDKLQSVSHKYIVTTDDGTFGRQGLVTEPLKELLEKDHKKEIGCVYAIGPAIMMKFCSKTTEAFGIKTIVSLNSIMVDGTGMCGVCRVEVGGHTRFTCVDGPEFDGHLVDWDVLLDRQKIYLPEEKESFKHYIQGKKENDA